MSEKPEGAVGRGTVRNRAAVVGAGALAAVLGWVVLVPLAGVELVVAMGGEEREVSLVQVIVSSLVGGLLGWGLLEILERLSARPRRVFLVVCVVGLVLSFLSPIASGSTTATKLGLSLLHVLVAAVVVPGMARTALERRRSAPTTSSPR